MTEYTEVRLRLRPDEPITREQFNDLMQMIGEDWEPEGQFEGELHE